MRVLPRRFRPHTVIITQYGEEDSNGVAQERVITLDHVKADTSYGIQQSKKGIDTDDKIIVYVELADYTAYDKDGIVLHYGDNFKIRTADALQFADEHYIVNAVNEVLLDSGNPVRLEVIAK